MGVFLVVFQGEVLAGRGDLLVPLGFVKELFDLVVSKLAGSYFHQNGELFGL